MEFDPKNKGSSLPLTFNIFSVNRWPLSKLADNWISSIATKSKFFSVGIASTVQKKNCAVSGIIYSSPVINPTLVIPTFFAASS